MCHRNENSSIDNKTPKEARDAGQNEIIGTYGDHNCDSPPELVDFMLDEAKRLVSHPDFIIWTGDTAAHIKYTHQEFIDTMRTVTDDIKQRFPNVLVIPILGNHDVEPSNNFPDDSELLNMYQGIFDLWKGWIGEESKDSSGKPVQRMFLNPAITPMFNLNNPAFRIFDYDRENFGIKDIRTFYVDLDQLNKEGANKVQAVLEYSMKDAYGLKNFDAEEMNNLAKRLARNDTLFNTYVRYNRVMNGRKNNDTSLITSMNRNIYICVIENLDLEELEHCISEVPSSALGKPSIATFIMFSVISFTALVTLFFKW
ncbi:Metallophos domain-containing protein [Meloidogyne graminicola]|uniref:Metallophos domain-containing protein n=1 Tax=Meloidogyne graminicola TaxID=189291 RepID=A0A8T0A494_9BILA|nr:Metallophos domain-containing protein [Meloidogyne graminicola]